MGMLHNAIYRIKIHREKSSDGDMIWFEHPTQGSNPGGWMTDSAGTSSEPSIILCVSKLRQLRGAHQPRAQVASMPAQPRRRHLGRWASPRSSHPRLCGQDSKDLREDACISPEPPPQMLQSFNVNNPPTQEL